MDWVEASRLLASLIGIAGQVAKQRGGDAGMKALKVATDLIRAVDAGDVSNVDPEAIRAELDKLSESLVENDAAADAALLKKFAHPTGDGES